MQPYSRRYPKTDPKISIRALLAIAQPILVLRLQPAITRWLPGRCCAAVGFERLSLFIARRLGPFFEFGPLFRNFAMLNHQPFALLGLALKEELPLFTLTLDQGFFLRLIPRFGL